MTRLLRTIAVAIVVALPAATFQPGSADARSAPSAKARTKAVAARRHYAKVHPPAAPIASARPSSDRVLSRAEVLATDPAILDHLGRHLIVGFETFSSVKALVERRAIAGIFITDHNVKRRSVAAVKADIDALQAIRVAQGLPPLIVSADQEGGSVSRLSPPLKRQPSLARAFAKAKDDAEREKAVRDYAVLQAAELTRLGVTMNFAPVVDLNTNPKRQSDGETRLRHRAIAADPDFVAKAASWYCDTLAQSGVMCTLKHFPGLGRVGIDTHRTMGEITATESQLRVRDWVPFVKLMNQPYVATMLAHVRLKQIDPETPASCSRHIISDILRDGWGHDGLLITDDFSMGAIVRRKGGVGEAAVKAFNAGADLVLVSFSDRHLNAVMTALIKADAAGKLDRRVLEKSAERIVRVVAHPRDPVTAQSSVASNNRQQ